MESSTRLGHWGGLSFSTILGTRRNCFSAPLGNAAGQGSLMRQWDIAGQEDQAGARALGGTRSFNGFWETRRIFFNEVGVSEGLSEAFGGYLGRQGRRKLAL